MKKYAAWIFALCGLAVQAQMLPQRDPTQPPASMPGDAANDAVLSPVALLLNGNGANVVVRDGKPFWVVGSRLVAPGQTVETYRLERITETEIWLRDASGLTKAARFAGVQRRISPAQCATSPTTAPSSKKSTKKTPPPRRAGVHTPSPPTNAHDC